MFECNVGVGQWLRKGTAAVQVALSEELQVVTMEPDTLVVDIKNADIVCDGPGLGVFVLADVAQHVRIEVCLTLFKDLYAIFQQVIACRLVIQPVAGIEGAADVVLGTQYTETCVHVLPADLFGVAVYEEAVAAMPEFV